MSKHNIVVIGNGMVGHHFVETLVGKQTGHNITVIGEEPRPAYDRVHLSEVFSGRAPEELALATRETYLGWGVAAHFGDPVTAIERQNKVVVTRGGRRFPYDKLVLATGSYPFVPPVPGSDHERCLSYRTIDDLGRIRAGANGSRVGVVVGGGLLGLECANALRNLGLETHVVEFAPGLMGVQLDEGGSRMLRRKVEALGVQVHTRKNTRQIVPGDSHALRMDFADETALETDLIVFSAGIRPRDELARAGELTVGERGGIVIDYKCKTTDSDIFAIGECALFGGRIYGLVAPGYRMAEAVAEQLSGAAGQFQGADMSTKLKLLGVDVGSIGDAHGNSEGAIAYVFSDERAEQYKRLVTSADGKQLLGAVLVGDCEDYDSLLQYHLNGIELPPAPEALIAPNTGERPTLGVAALPATATVCSCHNVTKGDIVGAIDGGCCSLAEIKSGTRASTGCGGCAAMLKNLVDDELSARGIAVDRSLCEHFPYTRQELYHLVRVGTIKTFAALLAQHGHGRGCDICKPAVASIMASLWNEHVLEQPHVGLQDTNDTFLANMQKDGSYSVVPRIPGGEITPEKLVVLGRVAQKYDLYTKITGGQRIDLFGARQHQLPEIWRELVDAGFETGHAYGKALRTVKSCVGSSWCRYGVQDSVAMAITIENRYKGLRSPHKLKSAVSGCTRECAEAQSKDFGVIATENGWNLYVCGNGGMKPRHADLFATDLDDQTLIRYIDRFLMFYIRTADRLQRTSVWLDNLEGGLDYLRQVVIEDSLGIAAELETQMAAIVGTYQCEWKTTIEDPAKLKRFREFVNSDASDSNVVFVRERGQIRPARPQERVRLVTVNERLR
ncbi:nitrite reductase large subunit NirB [Kineobactrum salinum]|uniref:Nitrite reductase large subunit n=1 Tax=Kineobactrum salinum TaxID=2708301 RepID=A0A6C0U1H2_9GAMM|nr:nitrite reductase large subunit NirB [Kineobactrum salinum]QIB65748.1 nitrite reductase large subunit [Kineobactrum salinum]